MRKWLLLLLILLGGVNDSLGQGTIEWGWRFKETVFTVGPTDTIMVRAKVYLRPSATEPVGLQQNGVAFTGDLQKTYQFIFGLRSSEFGQDLWGLTLRPGEPREFLFGQLIPIAPVAEGMYPSDAALLGSPITGGPEGQAPDNSFMVHVVPEPATTLLLLVGLCVGWVGRQR